MFVVAVLLFIVLVGILIFLYLLIVKPEGTLTVVYALRESPAPQAAEPAPPARGLADRLAQLQSLHGTGHLTDEEYETRRTKILDEI
jgi:hypothetical protein